MAAVCYFEDGIALKHRTAELRMRLRIPLCAHHFVG